MSKLLIILGGGILLNGISLAIFANLTLGTWLTVLLGLFFAGWGIFYAQISSAVKSGMLRLVRYVILVLLCVEFLFVGFIALYGQNDNAAYDEDCVIVLGAGIKGDRVTLPLKMRLDKAIEYSRSNSDAVIVVSGGQGFQETVTEAYAMEKYLVEQGVSKDKIIKEERATSTQENMRFSKELLDKRFNEDYKSVIITNNFHIYRSVYYARTEGFGDVSHIGTGIKWYNILPCYLRESLAILKMWILD